MLGKLLWCMISGRLKLPREYHKRAPFNLTELFPKNTDMYLVNSILDRCIVEELYLCLKSSQELLPLIDTALDVIQGGGQSLNADVPRPCRVCGIGLYEAEVFRENKPVSSIQFWISDSNPSVLEVRTYSCNNCGVISLL